MFTRRAFTGAVVAAAGATAASAETSSNVVLPMRNDYGVLWTSVFIDRKGPYRFIVHTGQTFFNVSHKLVETLGLRRTPTPGLEAYTPNGKLDLEVYTAKELLLGSAYRLKNVDLIARTYGSEELFTGTVPFLTAHPTSFDFSKNEVTFYQREIAVPPGASKLKLLQPPINSTSTTPVVQADLDGQRLKLVVNTGCYTSLVLYPAAVKRLKLWERYPNGIVTTDEDKETGPCETHTVRAGSLKIGDIEFASPVAELEDPQQAVPRAYIDADGFIGLDLLRRLWIAFDHDKGAAWFAPQAELMNEPFAYNRSGFAARTTDEDARVVKAVKPGGPAEKAGLQVGDRLALSPEALVQLNYALTLPADTKITFNVERDGKTFPVHIVLEELI